MWIAECVMDTRFCIRRNCATGVFLLNICNASNEESTYLSFNIYKIKTFKNIGELPILYYVCISKVHKDLN